MKAATSCVGPALGAAISNIGTRAKGTNDKPDSTMEGGATEKCRLSTTLRAHSSAHKPAFSTNIISLGSAVTACIMTSLKLEPAGTSDINNNISSPPKIVSISVPVRTPENSPCASPRTSKSSPVSLDLHSDLEDCKDEEPLDEPAVKGKRPPGAVRRRNERERNRVKHINRTFSVLRQHLPTRKANKKLSKVETLRSAVEYIKHLRQLLSDHDSLTAAISLEQALIAHNQRQRLLQQQHQLQQQQLFQRLQQQQHSIQYQNAGCPSGNRISLNSSLCSPTGPVQSPTYSPMISPTDYPQESVWEQQQADTNTDAELLDLAAESCITDMELW